MILNDYFHLHISATAIPRWIYQFSFDHWSQATSGPVSTWMGDRLGTPGAVGFFLLYTKLSITSLDSHLLHQIGELNLVIWVHIGWQQLRQKCCKWLTTFKPNTLEMVDNIYAKYPANGWQHSSQVCYKWLTKTKQKV